MIRWVPVPCLRNSGRKTAAHFPFNCSSAASAAMLRATCCRRPESVAVLALAEQLAFVGEGHQRGVPRSSL
ncbi:hypothetical protein MPL1032_140136 [Mesorhizobium plurifarium]|uniref:Uncharacterized protein n=1 Tax=Mesorhizobium plurifarium TaxID=69974 RepID=A0A0K2VS91_MESPL|nr:hypothetical protein MPL1032_140136 [Mesorhizobium plurifarium]